MLILGYNRSTFQRVLKILSEGKKLLILKLNLFQTVSAGFTTTKVHFWDPEICRKVLYGFSKYTNINTNLALESNKYE